MPNRRFWLIASAAAASAFVLANAFEATLIRYTGGNPWDLAYVSDGILAARIQRSALDRVGRPGAGLLWFAETRPAGKVGGDFYDLVPAGDGATLILVADTRRGRGDR